MSDADLTQSQLSAGDQTLIMRLQRGEQNAVGELESRHGDELRLFCRRMLTNPDAASDVVQDVFATCCRLTAESLPQVSIRGWLYQLARRRCIDVIRKRRDDAGAGAAAVRRVQPSFDHAMDPLTTPAGKALKRDRAERLLAVLDELDEDLRSVVVMRYFQDLPREEIAEAIGLTLAGTKARLSKAMLVLREKLGDMGESLT
ncbi:MAG: RNA polymerase sigma factor [Phycisphaerales bacterium]|nr:RNA polymerase sigma factor [Phycisphaerales bacterium]